MKLTDTHSHLYDTAFDADREEALARAAAAGEFKFSVRDAHGSEVATASNQASGDGEAAELTFSRIDYTTCCSRA